MLTIALNEYGDFHHLGQDKKNLKLIHFIAGVVYDDKGVEGDADAERRRIDAFFRRVAEDNQSVFPKDFFSPLHDFSGRSGESNTDPFISDGTIDGETSVWDTAHDNKKIAKYRGAIDKALPEFFKFGTYCDKPLIDTPRCGHYTIAAIVKSEKGKSFHTQDNLSNVLHDDVAGNLYWHMADSLVSRLLFTTPFSLHINKACLELPSQLIEVANTEAEMIAAFKELGYREFSHVPQHIKDRTKQLDHTLFQVVNDFTYRAALDRHMLEQGPLDLQIAILDTKGISYADGLTPEDTIPYAFSYLANHIIGDYIFHIPKRNGEAPTEERFGLKLHRTGEDINTFENMVKLANTINDGYKNLIFVYDDMDTYYEQAVTEYLRGDYFAALNTLYAGRTCESKFRSHYVNHWFPYVEALIHSASHIEQIEQAILAFTKYANNNRIDVDVHRLNYLYHHLKELVGDLNITVNNNAQLVYDFYDAGMTAFNHLGNSKESEVCFDKCQSLAKRVPLERYLLTLRRRIVAYIDSYKYEDALSLARYVVECEEKLHALRTELDVPLSNVNLAQAYSQIGQVFAYMQSAEAEAYFYKALDIFERHSADYYRTLSYLLHYFIDVGNQKKYETFAPQYFGGHRNVDDQFHYLWDLTDDDKMMQIESYALYVYVKALYTFYRYNASMDTIQALSRVVRRVGETLKHKPKGHPWELIFTYVALLVYQGNKDPYVVAVLDKYIDETVPHPSPAIRNIMTYGHLRIAQAKGNIKMETYWQEILEKEVGNIEQYMTYMLR